MLHNYKLILAVLNEFYDGYYYYRHHLYCGSLILRIMLGSFQSSQEAHVQSMSHMKTGTNLDKL